jgi:hypothetical protein
MPSDISTLHLRFPDDMAERIRRFARDTHRTINGAVAYLVEIGGEHEPRFPRPDSTTERENR